MKRGRLILRRLFSMLPVIWEHPLSIFGAGLTTTSAIVIVTVLLLTWSGFHSNPYTGIMVFVVMPVLFVIGLVLIPLGDLMARHKRARTAAVGDSPLIIQMNLNDARFQRRIMVVSGFTLLNFLIVSAVSYQAVSFMDSNEFCGTVCHTVMIAEYTSYQNSPHSRVECVSCHIGTGASWFVKSKLSGLEQVYAVALNNYPRPIPTPVLNLRPARETCEQCHWPEKFHDDRIRLLRQYQDDQQNSVSHTVLLMKVGGSNSLTGKAHGIHWHTDRNTTVEYIATDRQRQVIPWVRMTDPEGKVTEFYSPDSSLTPEEIARAPKRVMDCVDCHNRPTHIYRLPERALNEAFADNLLDPGLPYLRKVALAALQEEYPDKQSGLREIARRLTEYYQKDHPELWESRRKGIDRSIAQVQAIYNRNIYPEMKLTWGTYPDNIGHTDFPGCFRCHNDSHKSPEGKVISQDCETCHAILAFEESSPNLVPEVFNKR